ncbi:MAG: glycosyltransferase family 2 protein [Ilumatobacter sp.]|nr:glycosyltransferase family 2 protein [Ilumatobacter sp.]
MSAAAPRRTRAPIERVSVVMLAFDTPPGVLERSVQSVLADRTGSGGFPVELVVIDNGASAADRLRGVAAEVVSTGSNAGYAGGMNAGIRRALESGADAVALLNDDVSIDPGWLAPLVAELDADADVGAAQPTLLDGDGDTSAAPIVNSAGVVIDRFGAGSDRHRGALLGEVGSLPADIEAFTGGAVMLHRDFIADVGFFDERFFLYYEDVELARRGRRVGWRYRHVPAATVWHVGSATTAQLGDDVRRLQERNRIWSSAMHGSAGELARALSLSVRRLRHRPRRVHAVALLQGLAGVPSRLAARAGATRR